MQLYKIASYFPGFGVNKRQEIERLVYEISKRDKISPEEILNPIDSNNFESVKNRLLKIRFPYASRHNEDIRPHLPKIAIKPANEFNLGDSEFSPARIFIEKSAALSGLKNNFKKSFPEAKFMEISSLKDFIRDDKTSGISSYNKRRDRVFITNEKYDFFKKCPCTKGAAGCGYHIFNLGFGCIFDCTYCYLQEYNNAPGLIFPANIDKFFERFRRYKKPKMRIGTGEFSDSMMLDHITEYSLDIIEFFNNHKDAVFEFKTKSSTIDNILKARHSGNIVISWSLNPKKIIDKNEFFTASLSKRLESAEKCVQAGYKIGFHFDPVIYFNGWEKEYQGVIDLLFSKINPKDIAWISIGTFRFKPELKPIIENRFPENQILDEELLLGYDDKLRYPYGLRCNMYKSLLNSFKKHSRKLPIYLCMEEFKMWKDLNLLRCLGGV
ncbi:MAG: radical SAM protein [Candidatus Omnitrophica bacterium]|nr:radical SAM protein [Candidatus Omnitrophota bacterium]